MRLFLLSILCTPSLFYASMPYETPHKTPQQIQQELNDAEELFENAEKIFSPWYTGPLLTPSATLAPPGIMVTQPYLYITDNYAAFDSHRKSHNLNNALIQLSPTGGPLLQTGVTDSVDVTFSVGGLIQWQAGSRGGGLTDATLTLGFLVQNETPWIPKAKFSIKQTFPTGPYQHLNHNGLGLGGTGGGAYQTQFGIALGKVLFWATQHPSNLRLFLSYNIPLPVSVRGFNSYGGGYGTHATVRPGNTFNADMGFEVSISQTWVVSLDLAYTATNRTTFSGNPGETSFGTPATLAKGYSDNLSLAPAVEYNLNENSGFIGGLWCSVYGRNSLNFFSGILSYYISFGVT